MELPNKSKAHIAPNKISDYLLSEYHIVGKSKAKLLRSFGFNETNINQLESALIHIAQNNIVNEESKSSFGIKYVIDGILKTPNGIQIKMRTVWIIENNKEEPRFVTAYPIDL